MEEVLFEETNQMRDLIEDHLRNNGRVDVPADQPDFNESEVKLRDGYSVEKILHPDYPCEDFFSLARRNIVWLAPGVFITKHPHSRAVVRMRTLWYQFCGYGIAFSVIFSGTTSIDDLWVWRSPAIQTDTTVCDHLLVQLLARDDVPEAHLVLGGDRQCWVSSDALSLLLENDCPQLRSIYFVGSVVLTEDYLRPLEGARRPLLQISFSGENLSHFEPSRLQNCFRHCQVKILLDKCTIDVRLLSEVLRGHSKVVKLVLAPRTLNGDNTTFLFDLLDTNDSLTKVSFKMNPIRDENWIRLCRSIERHPRLQRLYLHGTGPTGEGAVLSAGSKALRANAIVQMIQANNVLQKVYVTPAECDERILEEVIRPYLHYARNIRKVNANRGNPLREQLLGRALYHLTYFDPTLLWMILSNDNMELLLNHVNSIEVGVNNLKVSDDNIEVSDDNIEKVSDDNLEKVSDKEFQGPLRMVLLSILVGIASFLLEYRV
jgi:hypothetical protein